MDIRELLRHIRTTESDRAIQRDTGIDRRTIQRYRAWATAQGLLDGPLPPPDQLQHLLEQTLTPPLPPQIVSSVEPFRDLVLELRRQGTGMMVIWERLKERGYTGSYSSLRRFVRQREPQQPQAFGHVETGNWRGERGIRRVRMPSCACTVRACPSWRQGRMPVPRCAPTIVPPPGLAARDRARRWVMLMLGT